MHRQRHMLLFGVLVSVAFVNTHSEPSCHSTPDHNSRIQEITCSDFNDPDALRRSIPQGRSQMKVWLTIQDCSLAYLPQGTFENSRASILKLKNVRLNAFVEPGSSYNPFEELEDTLEAIEFSHGSTLPESWRILKGMRRMEELRLFNMTGLRLTRDFNELPETMKLVVVVRSRIEQVDQDWMASLVNLEKVSILKSNLGNFSRSMLPRPANKLWRLTLDFANLTSLPSDFSDDFPALREVGVRNNHIRTFEETSMQQLKTNGTEVSLAGNPAHCDCRLRFLLSYPSEWYYPSCATPESLLGHNLKDLKEEQLKCHDVDNPSDER
ncbi:unnamed protein product [Ixodes hexagonus]